MKKSQCKTCSEGMLEKGLDFSKLGKSRSGRGGVGSNCNMETDSGSLVDGRLFCKIGHFFCKIMNSVKKNQSNLLQEEHTPAAAPREKTSR